MHWLPAILFLPYLFILLKIYRNLLEIKPFIVTKDPGIFVSVIVACRNEQENLPRLLNSLQKQDYQNELFEVIIVNDNSTDRTYEMAFNYNGDCNIIIINNDGKGKKQALRTGINASRGELIITTDADCLLGESWIRTIAAFYELNRPDMIIGPVKLESGPGFLKRFQELEFISLQGVTAGTSLSGQSIMCNGANLAFTRKSYSDNSNNLHDEIASGDDIFLLHSLKKKKGSKILWLESTDALVTTASSPSASLFFKQRKRWISKGIVYNDIFTIAVAILTFVTISLQLYVLISAIINPVYWDIFLIFFLFKSTLDLLIIQNTAKRYGVKKLMGWFLPSQFVYPLYVLGVVLYSLLSSRNQEY